MDKVQKPSKREVLHTNIITP